MNPRQTLIPTLSLALLSHTLASPVAIAPVYAQSAGGNKPLQESNINWWTVNEELSQALLTKNLGSLAQAALIAPAPATPKSWLHRLALLLRADYPKETLQFLKTRPPFLDAKTDWGLHLVIDQAGTYKDFALAKRLSELFPETRSMNWITTWAETVPFAEVDQWLAQQGYSGGDAWFQERLRLRRDNAPGTEQALLLPLEQAIREHPDDFERLLRYVNALPLTEDSPKTKWLATVLRPRLAIQGYLLADIMGLPDKVKIALYERSLLLPFTKRDVAYYAENKRKYPPGWDGRSYGGSDGDPYVSLKVTEPMLRAWTKSNLLSLYQQYNEPQKAQRLLEQLAKENPNGFLDYGGAQAAGQIQRGSGARVIETKILKEKPKPEAEDLNSVGYWIKRGQYYGGREDEKQAVAAFEKALTLTTAADATTVWRRGQVVTAYSQYWLDKGDLYSFQHRDAPVVEAYDKAIEVASLYPGTERLDPLAWVMGKYAGHYGNQSPRAGFDYAYSQLQQLQQTPAPKTPHPLSETLILSLLEFSRDRGSSKEIGHLAYDDPLLWGYLAALPKWKGEAGRNVGGEILEQLIKAAPEEKREAQYARAEAMLTGDALPQRLVLAETIYRAAGRGKALPYYRAFVERSRGKPEYGFGLEELGSGYAQIGDFAALMAVTDERRKLKPGMRGALSADSYGASSLTFAILAAKAGQRDEALRFVTLWANRDRRVAGSSAFSEIARRDLDTIGAELRAVFAAITKAEPECAAPTRLEKLLGELNSWVGNPSSQ